MYHCHSKTNKDNAVVSSYLGKACRFVHNYSVFIFHVRWIDTMIKPCCGISSWCLSCSSSLVPGRLQTDLQVKSLAVRIRNVVTIPYNNKKKTRKTEYLSKAFSLHSFRAFQLKIFKNVYIFSKYLHPPKIYVFLILLKLYQPVVEVAWWVWPLRNRTTEIERWLLQTPEPFWSYN